MPLCAGKTRQPLVSSIFSYQLAIPTLHERILPVDRAVAYEWGRLNASRPLPVIDGLLAATAKIHHMTLVTRNTADIADLDVHILNPFELLGALHALPSPLSRR